MSPELPLGLPQLGQVQPLVFYPSENLLTKSLEVPAELVPSDGLHELTQNMTATMLMTGGVGISAIQIGVPWRVIAVGVDGEGNRLTESRVKVMVNPVVIEASAEQVLLEEGCLSFPRVLENIHRPEKVVVSYMNPDGEIAELAADGWEARCILHEVDHLDGVLFTERMPRVGRRLALKKMSKLSKAVRRDGAPKQKPKKKQRKRR